MTSINVLYEELLGLFLKELEIQAFALRVQRIREAISSRPENEAKKMLFRNVDHKIGFQSTGRNGLLLKLDESDGYATAVFFTHCR